MPTLVDPHQQAQQAYRLVPRTKRPSQYPPPIETNPYLHLILARLHLIYANECRQDWQRSTPSLQETHKTLLTKLREHPRIDGPNSILQVYDFEEESGGVYAAGIE